MANGGNGNSTAGQDDKHLGWQIFSQSMVVILGLAAVVVCLALILDAYEVEEESSAAAAASATAAQETAGGSEQSGGKNGGGSPTGPVGGSPIPAASPVPGSTSVSSSSVVAILTPIMAGIVGIVGLFFGISATGSARGRQAGTAQTTADTTAKAADVNAKAIDLVTEVQQKESPGSSPGTQRPQGDDDF
jgi:uncharacterized membrane protein YuzA (DUF378 family)